jgi:uncharacterized protein YjbI with pentapeptide repeats
VGLNLDRSLTALDFCEQLIATKLEILQQLGLERYGKLLSQLPPTPGNLACVEKFLTQPGRMKFPQLQGTQLAGLDLRSTNLIRANFTDSDLRGCCLKDADVMFGNFTRADLRGANLQGATLYETQWCAAQVEDCDLRSAKGIAPAQQQWLQEQRAIFAG